MPFHDKGSDIMKYDKIKRILIVVITITYMAIGFTYQYRYDDETENIEKSTYQEHIRKRKMIYLLLLNLLKISEVTDINN